VLTRMEKLDRAVYTGFVMPTLTPVVNAAGTMTDIGITYSLDLGKQMLEYSAFTAKEKRNAAKELSGK